MDDNLIWNRAGEKAPVLIMAHGAGAGMGSDFMETMAGLLCDQGITVARFEFPYMQQRRATGTKRPPDRQPKLLQCWHEVIQLVKTSSDSPLFIGGKSMGGRMATLWSAEASEAFAIKGVVCLGYPFYAPGKQDRPRIEHLSSVSVPHLVVQGERDRMGDYATVSGYTLSENIEITWLADGDHDLKPRKSSGMTHRQHLHQAARLVSGFIRRHE